MVRFLFVTVRGSLPARLLLGASLSMGMSLVWLLLMVVLMLCGVNTVLFLLRLVLWVMLVSTGLEVLAEAVKRVRQKRKTPAHLVRHGILGDSGSTKGLEAS